MPIKVSERVAWSEGVLLLPQHFQQQDRHHEYMLAARLESLDPLSWGVLRVELDLRSLQQGTVALTTFEGVLPDGQPLTLSAQGGQRPPTERPIQGHFPAAQEFLSVYLGVPAERAGINNYARDGEPLRYFVAARKLFDASRDDQAEEISLAAPNAVLLFGDEPLDGFVSIKIAEVVRNARGEFTVSETYIPPCLRISASPVIMSRIERLLQLMVARHRALSESRRTTLEGRIEFTASDVTRYLQLNALDGAFPSIHYLARNADVPARTAFLMIMELAGRLATFSNGVNMTQPLTFDYANLKQTFEAAFKLAERVLAATDVENFVGVPLQPHGGSRYYGDLNDPRLDKCVRFLLAVESGLPRPQVVQEFMRRAKVASHDDLDIVLSTAVGGINVTEAQRPPAELPVRPGLVYFDLPARESDVYCKHVWQDRNVVVWLPPMLEQAQTSVKFIAMFG